MPLLSPIEIILTDDERVELERVARLQTAEQRDALRARIILAFAKTRNIGRIAAKLGITRDCVRKWVQRFEQRRLAGLVDDPRSGRPPRFSPRSGDVRDQAGLRAA
jgi:predicted ArsR family transcriptional regulator